MSANHEPRPTPKDVVVSIMHFAGREEKLVTHRNAGQTSMKIYLSYKCRKPGCPNPTVSFADKSGYNNPYRHLKQCYAKGHPPDTQDEILHQLYFDARTMMMKRGGTMLSNANVSAVTKYDLAMHAYIRLIVMKSVPLSCVEDPDFRHFCKYDETICRRTVTNVLFELVKLVEDRIKLEMRGTMGALMFDGWTRSSMHYVGVYASYTKTCTVRENAKDMVKTTNRLTLLGLSPLSQELTENGEVDHSTNEATSFNAEAHLKYFTDVLEIFGQSFSEWCSCVIADNCSTNHRIANLAGIPLIGCNSHKLNLEVNHMLSCHADLRTIIDSVHETMKSAKSKLKNAAVLRNITDLRPIINNATRWSGKSDMLERYLRLRDDLIEASGEPNADIQMDTTIRFKNKVVRYAAMLQEINAVTKYLQIQGRTLADCRDDIDLLIDSIAQENANRNSNLFNCRLGKKYIDPKSSIVHSAAFESGVVKLQRGLLSSLSDAEKEAVKVLAMSQPASSSTDQLTNLRFLTMREKLAKRRKLSERDESYNDCQFILGSAAHVERLWSVSKYVLTEHRMSMTPQLFEAIVFLRENERFWDMQLVAESIGLAKRRNSEDRLAQRIAHEEYLDSN